MYVDYFFWVCLSTSGTLEGSERSGKPVPCSKKFMSRGLKGKKRGGLGREVTRSLSFSHITSSPEPARRIFEHSLAQAKGTG